MTRFAAYLPMFSIFLVGVAGAQTTAVPTLKANTKIVVIDVVVTDKQGQPVKDLKAADFALAENGAPQTISHFDAHASLSAEEVAKVEAMPKLAPNVFTNYSPVPPNASLNVLLLDEYNTKMVENTVVLKQALKYLSTPHPGARMEIFELSLGMDLQLLQGFTSDPEILRTALTNKKDVPHIGVDDGQDPCLAGAEYSPSRDSPNDWSKDFHLDQADSPGGSVTSAAEKSATRECDEARRHDQALSTLHAMEALARYMGGLPGRKNLLWFSTAFWLPTNKNDISAEVRKVMTLFAKNQVAVYSIGAKGLVAGGRLALDRRDAEVAAMETMAEQTGGKVFAGSNDIAGEAERAVDDGSNYYTLTYTPVDRNWKGEFRKVEVKLAETGYTLAYRPGYIAEDADKAGTKMIAENSPVDPATTALKAAMEYGSPQPSEIVLTAKVNPATGLAENVVATGNGMAPKVTGPYERYVVSVAAAPAAFTFTQDASGKHHLAAKLVSNVYTADGVLINSTIVDATGDIDDARYQLIMSKGMQFKVEISVPLKGESFLRIGVEDLPTNRVGVVEIPVSTIARLTPLVASAVAK